MPRNFFFGCLSLCFFLPVSVAFEHAFFFLFFVYLFSTTFFPVSCFSPLSLSLFTGVKASLTFWLNAVFVEIQMIIYSFHFLMVVGLVVASFHKINTKFFSVRNAQKNCIKFRTYRKSFLQH